MQNISGSKMLSDGHDAVSVGAVEQCAWLCRDKMKPLALLAALHDLR
jgi:hypothetical protein